MIDAPPHPIIGGWHLDKGVTHMAIGIILKHGKRSFVFLRMNNPECSIDDIYRRLKRCYDIPDGTWTIVGMLRQVNTQWVYRTYPEIYSAWMKIKSWGANYVMLLNSEA